jgi:hypothetical protein
MQQFDISMSSFRQVRDFVNLAKVQSFDVRVDDGKQEVNGKNYLGMFSMDHRQPLHVSAYGEDEECSRFQAELAEIL